MNLELTVEQAQLVLNALRAEVKKGQNTFLTRDNVDDLELVISLLKAVG